MLDNRVEVPPLAPWLAALPLLFTRRSRRDSDVLVASALASAAAALEADSERRDTRSRVCFLLAELGAQFARRTGDYGAAIPVTRSQLARAARISLPRVKRILGFLFLSEVVEQHRQGLRITDWPRLCRLGIYDPSWLPMAAVEPEEGLLETVVPAKAAMPPPVRTVAGDPASFV